MKLPEGKEEKNSSQQVLQEEQETPQVFGVEAAELLLKLAETIKKALPSYSIANIICGLQK
jgi:hypothetical protein